MARTRTRLITIVYRSTAQAGLGSIDLHEILHEARVRNRAAGVTGMLLMEGGHFLQALEGTDDVVRPLMEQIAADPRHTQVRILADEPIPARRFPDWAMANAHAGDLEARPLQQYIAALENARAELPKPASRTTRFQDWLRG